MYNIYTRGKISYTVLIFDHLNIPERCIYLELS